MREIKERVRGRILRVGTLFILVVVAAAIIIPTLHSKGGLTTQTVGVVGGISSEVRQAVDAAGSENQDSVKLIAEQSLATAEVGLRSGKLDIAIIDAARVLLNKPVSSSNSPADSGLVGSVSDYLGVLRTYQAAGLTPAQATQVSHVSPVPVESLEPGSNTTTQTTSVIGLVLLFIMLSQYNTWILIGVMQEKSSRVVEVLLATVRPIQLLGGKVLGIGLVALAQATLIVSFALVLGAAVGSDLLHGAAPLVLVCELIWLVLGYAFYCWVYAAGGSTAERQDQVQTLALPLSIPILVGYVFSITVASTGHPDLIYKVLAYLPPTAPFCMPVLVGLNQVTWWEFVGSALITVASTFGMARFAARIYRRAVLRTGGRVKIRELLAGAAH
jgi:ABC-2 type transport system permease protein